MGKYVHIINELTKEKNTGFCDGKITDFLRSITLVNPYIELNGKDIKSNDDFNIDDSYELKNSDDLLIINQVKGGAIKTINKIVDPLGVTGKAGNYVLSSLFNIEKPSIPRPVETDRNAQQSEFTVNTSQNQARNGQPIPECFGTYVRTPDIISTPYRRYDNNKQYLYMILCLGVGENTINDVFIEDTNITEFSNGVIEYRAYKNPTEHTGNDKIKDDWDTTFSDPYMRDVVITSREIQNIELTVSDPFDEIQLNPDNTLTDYIEFDIQLPNGLTNNNSNGSVTVEFSYRNSSGTLTTHNETITANTINPIRRTFGYSVTPDYYKTRAVRITPDSTSNTIRDNVYLETMKSYLINNDITGNGYIDYGDITLMAVKIKATQGISDKGQFKVKVNATRDGLLQLKDIMEYIWTSDNGGRQSLSDIDLPNMPELYNNVISRRTTVYNALQSVGTSHRYNVFNSSNILKARKDVPQSVRNQVFSEVNILKDTLKIETTSKRETDYDGVRVLYRDADTFEDRFAVYPASSSYPEEFPLDGVTDPSFAQEQAEFLYKQDRLRNIRFSLDTELDGQIASLFDRCAISHPAISKSQGGLIVNFSTNTVTLNETIKSTYSSPRILFRSRLGEASVLYDVLDISGRVLTLDVSVNPLPNDLYIGDDEQKTIYQLGEGVEYIKDIIITEIKPKRNNVIGITAWNYNESIYP